MADTLVIVPTYDEIESLAGMIERIRRAVPDADVLVVDDASPDGTGDLADRIAAQDSHVRVLHRAGKDGLGRAYLAGFEVAINGEYTYAIEIDADGSHDPAELPAMLQIAADGADLVIGSRWIPGGAVRNWPRSRQFISRAGNTYARLALRSNIRDITAGFRVFRVSALRSAAVADVASDGYCFQVEVAWRLEKSGHRVAEHPIIFVERELGRSKMHTGIVVEALLRVTGWGITSAFRPTTDTRASVN